MFALLMIVFVLSAGFGGLVLLGACLLLASPRFRRLGATVLLWGAAGAAGAFALLALDSLLGGHTGPLLGRAALLCAATGFGIAGAAGGFVFLAVRGLRLPNRWADRRRSAPLPDPPPGRP